MCSGKCTRCGLWYLAWSRDDSNPLWLQGYDGGCNSKSEALTDCCSIRARPAPPVVSTPIVVRAIFFPFGRLANDMLAYKRQKRCQGLVQLVIWWITLHKCNLISVIPTFTDASQKQHGIEKWYEIVTNKMNNATVFTFIYHGIYMPLQGTSRIYDHKNMKTIF